MNSRSRLFCGRWRKVRRSEEVCRKAGISEATCYNWRKTYGGLMPSEMKRLKQLEEENQRLKKLVPEHAEHCYVTPMVGLMGGRGEAERNTLRIGVEPSNHVAVS